MSDSIPNFSDMDLMGDTSYSGLSDTAFDFSGSSTMQDVQLGSPLVLDTSYGVPSTNVTDLMSPVPLMDDPDLGSVPTQLPTQSLTGASTTPPSPASAAASTPTPNVGAPNSQTSTALTALSKFGASFATLMGGQPVQRTSSVAPQFVSQAGGQLPAIAGNGTATIILVIVLGALAFLLLRGDE